MTILILDLETRSKCDLLTAGAYEYAAHDSTEILCIGYDLDGERGCVDTWRQLPLNVTNYIRGVGLVAAFNAQFDREVWNACEPEHQIADNRWYCVAAQCRVNALPSSLSDAGRALFSRYIKDFRGGELIRLLSLPREDGTFLEDPSLMQEMREYCLQDVAATVEVMDALPLLSGTEHEDWLVNERINATGIKIDRLLAQTCVSQAEDETAQIATRLYTLTGGEITKHTQSARIREWVKNLIPIGKLKYMERPGDKLSLDKSARTLILDDPEIPIAIKEVVGLMDEGNRSSVAKFSRMLARSESDGVARGSFVYAGASQTLRYASRGLQLHNMTRDCFTDDETDTTLDAMIDEDKRLNMKELSRLLRPTLVPEHGSAFIVGDWSSIEARVLPWLSMETDAESRLKLFRAGKDLYQVTADALFKGDRLLGKVAELALGFGGAVGAFSNMARVYGLDISEAKMKSAVKKWRAENQWAVAFWSALEYAAGNARRDPGRVCSAGKISYMFMPELIGGTLVCTLPDGSTIKYPRCKFEEDDYGRSGLTAMKASVKPPAGSHEWPRVRLWGGMLAENVTQATAAALLREALRNCEDEDLTVVGHVHDEIIVECADHDSGEGYDTLKQIMECVPPWAPRLPIAAELDIKYRYGK